MEGSLHSRSRRAITRLFKEIRESKWQFVYLAVIIRTTNGSFTSFWASLTRSPAAPFLTRPSKVLAFKTGCLGAVYCTTLLMWKFFRRRQKHLPSPWKDVNLDFFLQALPGWSPLRGLHFLLMGVRVQSKSLNPARQWHFRQTLVVAYIGCILWAAARRGGVEALLNEVHSSIHMDLAYMVFQQALCVFRQYPESSVPLLNYRHKPCFAWAAISQACALLLPLKFYSTSTNFTWSAAYLHTVPITSVATMLLYVTYAKDPDYLNQSMLLGKIDEEPASVFCEICLSTALSSSKRENTYDKKHHLTATGLRRSAESGCCICAALWERRARVPKDFVKNLKFWLPTTTFSRFNDMFVFRFKQDATDIHECCFQIYKKEALVCDRDTKWSEDTDTSPQFSVPKLSHHTGGDDSLDLAVSWLQNCLIYHGVCNKNRFISFKPSRLLWVGNDQISIHVTEDMPKKVLYLTLSHCWGRSHIIRLLNHNQDSLRNNIPPNKLPKTFLDAVALTRRLGFSYLWIDSLCIIQDSADDWAREAKIMGEIYKNAICNIAASDAPDSSHGCFYPRNPRLIKPVLLTSKAQEEEYLINETDIFDNHVLYTRAWVLQEAILARRTLDCGRGQLFWRCGEMRASEVFPVGVPRCIHGNHPASKFETKPSDINGEPLILDVNILEQRLRSRKEILRLPTAPGKGSVQPRSNDSTFALWAAIVGYYTGMHLTKETDRTVALSGIIDKFRPFFGAHYHGLWHIFMPVELLWVSAGSTARPLIPRAPTWSWMSLEGPMTYEHCKFEYSVDILITRFLGVEIKGQETQLCLSTILLSATWEVLDKEKPRKPIIISSIEGTIQPVEFMGMRITTRSYGEIHFDHWDENIPMESIFCMPMKIDKSSERWLQRTGLNGLVLQEVQDGVFKRLGYFEASPEVCMPFLKQGQRRQIVIV